MSTQQEKTLTEIKHYAYHPFSWDVMFEEGRPKNYTSVFATIINE